MSYRIRAVCFFLATLIFSSQVAHATPLPQKPHIYVEGSATIDAEPDTITFSLELEKTDPELENAKKDVDQRSFRLIKACKQLDVPSENISTTALRIFPAFRYRNGEQIPNGTTVSRKVDIKLEDLSRYQQVMKALVDANISSTVSTQLSLSNDSHFTDKALEAALEDAEKRAKVLAKAQGKKIIGVHSISEFQDRRNEMFQLIPSRSIQGQSGTGVHRMALEQNQFQDAGEPFEPGRMKATAKVYVVYLIN